MPPAVWSETVTAYNIAANVQRSNRLPVPNRHMVVPGSRTRRSDVPLWNHLPLPTRTMFQTDERQSCGMFKSIRRWRDGWTHVLMGPKCPFTLPTSSSNTLCQNRVSNFPCRAEVVVTFMASCPPPNRTYKTPMSSEIPECLLSDQLSLT